MSGFLKFITTHAKSREALRWLVLHWEDVRFYWAGFSVFGGIWLIYQSHGANALSAWPLNMLHQTIWAQPSVYG